MQFLAPLAWAWAALLVAVVALYLLRRRSQPVPVSTLPFFRLLHRHLQEQPWLRRLKRWLSFLVTVLVLLALIAALARPALDGGDEVPDAVVVVIDRSASLGAVADERSALAEALAELRPRLRALPATVPVAVVASDAHAEVLVPLGRDRLELARRLDEVSARPLPADHEPGLALARHLLHGFERGELWWVGDRLPADEVDRAILAAPRGINAGITACSLRRRPGAPNTIDCFVAVLATVDGPAKIETHYDGEFVGVRTIDLVAGEERRLLLPEISPHAKELELRLIREGDCLSADDRVVMPVPEARRIRVAWVTAGDEDGAGGGDGFTALALATMPAELAVERVSPADFAPERADVVIAQGWLPEPAQVAGRGLVLLDPPGDAPAYGIAAIEARLTVPRPRADLHHLLFGVSTQRLQVAQTAVLDEQILPPVWGGDRGTLLAAGRLDDRPVVVMAFDPLRSPELALTVSWPSLLANTVLYAADLADDPEAVAASGSVHRPAGDELHWDLLSGGEAQQAVPPGGAVVLDRLGIWSDGEHAGAVALLAPDETRLGGDVATAAERVGGLAGADWPLILILGACLLLVAECVLFHRWGMF